MGIAGFRNKRTLEEIIITEIFVVGKVFLQRGHWLQVVGGLLVSFVVICSLAI